MAGTRIARAAMTASESRYQRRLVSIVAGWFDVPNTLCLISQSHRWGAVQGPKAYLRSSAFICGSKFLLALPHAKATPQPRRRREFPMRSPRMVGQRNRSPKPLGIPPGTRALSRSSQAPAAGEQRATPRRRRRNRPPETLRQNGPRRAGISGKPNRAQARGSHRRSKGSHPRISQVP
jgi:hypothetical protein